MSLMPSTTVPGAESIPSRLGRLRSSHQLLLTRQSLFLAGACFLSFKTHTAVRSLGRRCVEVCPAKRGTPSHIEAKRLSTAV